MDRDRRPSAALGPVRAGRRRRRAATRRRASGADSMVVDLEEPRTPYPERERERGRRRRTRVLRRARCRRARPLAVRAGAAAVDRPDAQGPARGDRPEPRPASCVPKIEHARPTCTRPTRCSRCMEVDFDLPPGEPGDLPDPRDRAGDPPRVRDRDRVATRVAYMGGAISRFGDIHQALGYRWTAEGEETLFLRSKVLVDAKAAGIRYPISGMWGGAPRRPRRAARVSRRSCATSATTG